MNTAGSQQKMEIYLVGGAVRDALLNIPVKDRDWLVTGSTPEEMIAQHFTPVGKDFPVFLHPKTKEEYALARTERKSGKGYTGFQCYSSPEITLEEDLSRRDLTINAIAQNSQGQRIDPFNGQLDIKNRVLRHVSPAFREDPLRLLRVARFAARFAHLGFTVADETLALMREIVNEDELEHLSAERIWQEFHRALSSKSPGVFIEVLRSCGALARLLPEIDRLFGVPQPEKHHPEIDTGIHTLMVLRQAALLTNCAATRFAALTHDLGKGTTPREAWPRHIAHEERGVKLIEKMGQRLRLPKDYIKLAKNVARYHTHCHRALELRADTLVKTLENINAYRQAESIDKFLIACEADSRGRLGYENKAYPQAALFKQALAVSKTIQTQPLLDAGFKGKALGEEIYKQRVKAVKTMRENWIEDSAVK